MAEKLPLEAVAQNFNTYASSPDAKNIYTVVDYKRKSDGTLHMRSTLSNPDSNGYYRTNAWDFYDAAGTTKLFTWTWTITYDAQGQIISKVVS